MAALGAVLAAGACLAAMEPNEPPFDLAPPWVALIPGDSTQLALVRRAGDTVSASEVAWSSSHPSVASVDGAGRVTSRSPGVAVIRGRIDGMTAPATVVVAPPVLVGAGDIGACASSGAEATARLLDGIRGVVFTAGDNAYPDGTALDFEYCYAPTWGRHRARTRPSPGNHDYHTPGATGYFRYFGVNAGDPALGYYTYDLGSWHVIVLNTNVPFDSGSVQGAWLTQDLEQHATRCAVAYWHFPRFSSGFTGSDARIASLWEVLEDGGVDVAIVGHDHNYERFAPQRADGTADSAAGIREFVVGTGGGAFFPMGNPEPNSEVRIANTFGVLELTLDDSSYSWRFLRAPDGMVLDSGTGTCH